MKIKTTKIFKLIAIIPLFAFGQPSNDQQQKVDSLKKVIAIAKHDSIKVKALMQWEEIIQENDPQSSFSINHRMDSLCKSALDQALGKQERTFFLRSRSYALYNLGRIYFANGENAKAYEFASKSFQIRRVIGDKKGSAQSLISLGHVYAERKDHPKALDYYSKAHNIFTEIGNKKGSASALLGMGQVYVGQALYEKAIDCQSKSMKLFQELGNKMGESYALCAIATIYGDQGENDLAIKYFTEALEIQKVLNDTRAMAVMFNNIGLIYKDKMEFEKAIDYYTKSLELERENGNQNGIAMSLNNIGVVYYMQKKYDDANKFYKQSLDLCTQLNDKQCMAMTLNNIGGILGMKRDFKGAYELSMRALKIAKEIGSLNDIRDASQTLYYMCKELGKSEQAMEMYEQYIIIRDSINSQENQRAVLKQQFKYAYEKQAAADSVKMVEEKKIKDTQIALQRSEIRSNNILQIVLFGGLTLLLVFAGFIYNRFRITQKQKLIIEEQKHTVEEKNQEILDSITYAKRIQSAILPPMKLVKEYLHESFILYLPKDIVAGDFYWMENVNETVLFAAADCTGHGVPGAMVSVVCNNGLNRSVREYGLTDPGQILDKTREIIIKEFEKSEEEVKDGMDISLCALDTKNKSLKWAGANNPIWIVRQNGELEEIKANKQPIGKYAEPKPFTTHTIQLNTGDSVYIFTDGYQDQFGGENGKKFKAAKMKQLLQNMYTETMDKKRELILKTFENWKGTLEQVDDVCIMGIRI